MPLHEIFAPYRLALWAALAIGFLFMVQTIVGAVVRKRSGHPGGLPVPFDHDNLLFRVDRARANTFEVLGVFVLALVVGIALQAHPVMFNTAAVVVVLARALHMATYYANQQAPRTLSFVIGNVGTAVMLVASVRTLLGW